MSNFILSGFADEIDPSVDVQLREMQRFGIGYIEMRGVDGKNIAECSKEEIRAVAKKCRNAGVRISAVGSPLGKINISDDMEPHMESMRDLMEKAKILGTEYIRVFSFYMPQGEAPEKYRDEVLKRMERMAAAAKQQDIVLLHENEKGIYGDTPERCLDVLESIGSEHMWATFDPANFIQCGCQPYPSAYEMLKPYIRYIHIKDATKEGIVVPSGQGVAQMGALLKRVKEDGYQGFLSLEPHLGDFAGFAALEAGEEKAPKAMSGADTFEIAVNALRDILKEVM